LAEEIVETKYILNVDDYVKNINKAQDETEELDRDQDKLAANGKISWGKMGIAINQWLEVAKKAKELLEVIVRVAVDFRNAADDQIDSIDALNLQLRNMNQYTIYTSESLQNMAKELENTTNFTDNQVMEAQKLMLTFSNISTDILPDAIEKLLDMSEVMGMDTKSAAIQLGKALNDPIEGVTALKRVGVVLSEQQKASIQDFMNQNDIMSAQKVILGELNKEFGGHAKLQKDELETLGIAWKNFKETLGVIVKPALDGVSLMFGSILKNITDILQKGEDAKNIASNDTKKVTTDALQKNYEENKKKLDAEIANLAYLKSENEKLGFLKSKEADNRYIMSSALRIENLNKSQKIIEAELKARYLLNAAQTESNKLADKEMKQTTENAIKKEAEEKRMQSEKNNTKLKLTTSKDPFAGRFGDFESYETKVTLSELTAQIEVNKLKEEEEKKHLEKMQKIKDDNLDYTKRLNEDIAKRDAEQKEEKAKKQMTKRKLIKRLLT